MNRLRINSYLMVLISVVFFAGSETLLAESQCESRIASATAPVDSLLVRASRISLAVARQPIKQNTSNSVNPDLDIDAARRKATEGSDTAIERGMSVQRFQFFDVIENLKNAGPDEIVLPATDWTSSQANQDFAAHRDAGFWENDALGRAGFDEQCRFSVDFQAGHTYLLFLGPIHVKAYELIEVDDDRWLAYVRQSLSETDY